MTHRNFLRRGIVVTSILGWLLLTSFGARPSAAQGFITPTPLVVSAPLPPTQPVVHAVMFWMNGCPHCHAVIDNVLPPIQAKYGAQFDLQLIEVVTTDDIDRLYQVGATFGLAKEQVGVPFLIIGDRALVGSDQIPAELPQLIEQYLTSGGVAYPQVFGLPPSSIVTAPSCSIATPCAVSAAQPEAATTSIVTPALAAAVSNGFVFAITIMIAMVGAMVYSGFTLTRVQPNPAIPVTTTRRNLAFVTLLLIGLSVASYLTYVETQATPAVCGPIGDCNAVQRSPYAYLFGVLPIGVLGIIGYGLISITWLWGRLRSDRFAITAPLIVFSLAMFGVLFSLYLTFLEPFVIGAVCVWCLTSTVVMTLLMLISVPPARQTLNAMRGMA